MISVVDIAFHSKEIYAVDPVSAGFSEISEQYAHLGLLLNEMKRSMGLIDLVPEVHTGEILQKIECVHTLMRNAAGR
jgi:hypothetical protein